MPAIYTVTPLNADGQIIYVPLPYLMPREDHKDPMKVTRCCLMVDDTLLTARGADLAKRRKLLLKEIEKHFMGRGIKLPFVVPMSCTRVVVTAGTPGTCTHYEAVYNISPFPYMPSTLRIKDEAGKFADYYGQPFEAEWCPWPFGDAQTRRVWTAIRLRETVPFALGTPEYYEFTADLAQSMFSKNCERGAYITERDLRYGEAVLAAPRRHPTTEPKSKARAFAGMGV